MLTCGEDGTLLKVNFSPNGTRQLTFANLLKFLKCGKGLLRLTGGSMIRLAFFGLRKTQRQESFTATGNCILIKLLMKTLRASLTNFPEERQLTVFITRMIWTMITRKPACQCTNAWTR